MKRLALVLVAVLVAPAFALGATLTVSAVNPFGAPSSGTGLMLVTLPPFQRHPPRFDAHYSPYRWRIAGPIDTHGHAV